MRRSAGAPPRRGPRRGSCRDAASVLGTALVVVRGFRSIDLVRRERDHDVEFMTLMWFDTLDGVKEFKGEDYEAAHVPTQAQAGLAGFGERPAHYEGVDHRGQPPKPPAPPNRPPITQGARR